MTRIKQLIAALMVAMLAVGGAVAPAAAYEDEDLPVEDTLEVDSDEEHTQILITAAEDGDLDVTVEDDEGSEVYSDTHEDLDEHETIGIDVSDEDSDEFVVEVDETHPHSMTPVYEGEEYEVEVDEDDTAAEVFAEFDEMTDVAITVEAEDEDEETVEVVEETLEHVHVEDDDEVGAAELDVDGDHDTYTLVIEHDADLEPEETGYLTGDAGGISVDGDDFGVMHVVGFVVVVLFAGTLVGAMRE